MAYRVGDEITGVVSDFGSAGEGVVKDGSYPVFVPYAIKGETVSARITYAKKDFAFGELIEVLSPSNDRIKPVCPYFGRCGGCDLQHISRDLQLELKRQSVVNALRKNAGIDIDVAKPVRLNDWAYRNKLSLPFGYNPRSKRVSLGFYEKKTHNVVPMKWCPLHGDWAAKLISCVTAWANDNNVSVYNERTQKGLLRHLVARKLDTLCITLVINGSRVPNLNALIEALQKEFSDFTIYISENTKDTNVILGDSVRLVFGKERAQDLGKFSAVVSPLSFLQVNDEVRDAIYDAVCDELKDFDGDIVELYSGIGLLTAQIALRLPDAKITAVEIVPSATQNANALMKKLCLSSRVENVCDDAVHYLTTAVSKDDDNTVGNGQSVKFDNELSDDGLQEQNILPDEILNSPLYLGEKSRIDSTVKKCPSENNVGFSDKALILDPPRKGCDKEVLAAAMRADFAKIIYISCNPQTLARDVKILSEKYGILSVRPYDMFPQTAHIETLICLKRKNL